MEKFQFIVVKLHRHVASSSGWAKGRRPYARSALTLSGAQAGGDA
jgi:hypothetical protein